MNSTQAIDVNVQPAGISTLADLAPRPTTIEQTGLTESFVVDLVAKHLIDGGVLTMSTLCKRMGLSAKVLDEAMTFMRQAALVEVLAASDSGSSLRYHLTDRGRATALEAMARNGYVGKAPVPLARYRELVKKQTVHGRSVTLAQMQQAFGHMVLREELRDQLGPAMNSGRAIFIYGPAGTGKTYITQRLARLFPHEVLIPHAIMINEYTVSVFDPILHKAIEPATSGAANQLVLEGHDARFVACERPVLISGGELTADMLEVQFDASTKTYRAPLQLKANNGIYIIDDMGRQQVAPETVFNRWIVPLEEKVDYLSLGTGQHFDVPFDVILIFSTNLHPLDLADEAFLRRIGYKIEFGYLEPKEYDLIWQEICEANDIRYDPAIVDFVISELHETKNVPLLPCHPRDLINIAIDRCAYQAESRELTPESLVWAWNNYFVSMKNPESFRGQARVREGDQT